MTEQVITLVKVPIGDIEQWLREKHVLPPVLSDFRLEEKNLVLYFREEETSEKNLDLASQQAQIRKRRARKKRNRMRTRGWEVLTRITNSKGQYCAIYKPFAEALQDPRLTVEEQKKIVERILRSNRNRPSEASIQYFLGNTLEYLEKKRSNPLKTG
jgi:hypothetical protein